MRISFDHRQVSGLATYKMLVWILQSSASRALSNFFPAKFTTNWSSLGSFCIWFGCFFSMDVRYYFVRPLAMEVTVYIILHRAWNIHPELIPMFLLQCGIKTPDSEEPSVTQSSYVYWKVHSHCVISSACRQPETFHWMYCFTLSSNWFTLTIMME